MIISRSIAIVCFLMVMLLTALAPPAWKHPPLSSGATA